MKKVKYLQLWLDNTIVEKIVMVDGLAMGLEGMGSIIRLAIEWNDLALTVSDYQGIYKAIEYRGVL